jgi:predicted site-specific integrase-resolvase
VDSKVIVMNEDYIDSKTAAKLIGITVPTLNHHVRHGHIETIGLFGGSLVFSRKTVEKWIAEREANKQRALKEPGR